MELGLLHVCAARDLRTLAKPTQVVSMDKHKRKGSPSNPNLYFSHFTRACDTLRIILSNFLPTIQENLDSWAANGLGVDVTREDRQRKCAECQRWLLQIKNLPESTHFGSTLSQLQNIIIF